MVASDDPRSSILSRLWILCGCAAPVDFEVVSDRFCQGQEVVVVDVDSRGAGDEGLCRIKLDPWISMPQTKGCSSRQKECGECCGRTVAQDARYLGCWVGWLGSTVRWLALVLVAGGQA